MLTHMYQHLVHTTFFFFLAINSRVYKERSLTLLTLYHRLYQINTQKRGFIAK